MKIIKKYYKFWLAVLFLLVVLSCLVVVNLPDNNLHLVFCDVGQGDAILISHQNKQVLIDGGLPKNSGRLLSCLSSSMPFWDRTIEMVVNTHPDEDHFGGLTEVVKRYRIEYFLHSGADNENSIKFKDFKKTLFDKKVCSKTAAGDESFRVGKLYFESLFPFPNKTEASVGLQNEFFDRDKKCPAPVFETKSDSLNNSSIVLHFKFGDFNALLTGDIDAEIEKLLVWRHKIKPVEVLKIAHHGSRHSTSREILTAADPKLAVITVGENSFGHPAKDVLHRLDEFGIRYFRTDKEGTIRIVSDGRKWRVK